MQSERRIIHIDMDAFYASVEQLDNPELRGKPIAVGGSERRGVVSAASYEARKFGVRSAISGVAAKRYCPQLIFVPLRFDRYREVSNAIRSIFYDYTDLVEPLSLDEAYLDVTVNKKNNPSATLLASEIRRRIFEETGLTASAGISYNKFVAKVASDFKKPNGQTTVTSDNVLAFLANLPVSKFYGIGKVTAERMYQLGIFTGADLIAKPLEYLQRHFGNSGQYYYDISRGIHHSEVSADRLIKSVAAEHTFEENLSSEVFMEERLEDIASQLTKRLERYHVAGKTVTLKIKYSDFTVQTRSTTLTDFIAEKDHLLSVARELLYQERLRESVRLLGISLSNLNTAERTSMAVQLRLDL